MTTNLVVLQTATGNPLKLHHTVLKAATKRGFYFVETDKGQFRLVKIDDPTLMSAEAFDATSEAFEAFDGGEVTFEAPKQDKPSSAGRCGVMSTVYHSRYSHNPHGPGSGDELDCAMRDTFMANLNGKLQIDADALRLTGEANDVWNPSWDHLNPGLRRMNLANRLRARLRNKAGDVVLLDRDGNTVTGGRFGIEYKGKGK